MTFSDMKTDFLGHHDFRLLLFPNKVTNHVMTGKNE